MEEARVLDRYDYETYLEIAGTTQERVELIFGKIYMMAGASAEHQDILGNIFYLLKSYARKTRTCLPRIAPYDLKLTVNDTTNVVQPDIMLFCDGDVPCAIFEVLSASTALKDKTVKKELYEKSGIEEYFLVNTEYKIIDKFALKNGSYVYIGAYGEKESLPITCLGTELEVEEIFEMSEKHDIQNA